MRTLRDFLLIAFWNVIAMGVSVTFSAQAAEPQKPNVLVIVADDLGYADLGVQGCRDVPTPQIDSIALAGVRFTSGYVSCPVCSPTRAGLHTGRYQQRFGHEFNPGPAEEADPKFGLPLTEMTIANRMKAIGYATGAIGKWHLGYRPDFHPLKRGYDEFFGFLGGSHSYQDNRDTANPVMRGTEPISEVSYTTDMFGDEAAALIRQHQDHPWMLYLAFNAVHTPLQTTDERYERFASITDSKRRHFAAMLAAMDENVGKVLAQLRASKLEERTLILFVSDNGGPTPATGSLNTPLDGHKGEVKEGGIRVPMVAQWKGRIQPGQTFDRPVIALDFLPTAVVAGGGAVDPAWELDGVDLMPYLTGAKRGAPHEFLFWRQGDAWAVRSGDWKLRLAKTDDAPKLFNLNDDISEQRDVLSANPEVESKLKEAWSAWNAQLDEPLWRTQKAGKVKKNQRSNKNDAA